jgi:hypothetical protein
MMLARVAGSGNSITVLPYPPFRKDHPARLDGSRDR